MATKKKKTKKKALYLELDGEVNIIEVDGDKKTSTPIEGDLVLRILLSAIEDGIKLKLNNKPKKSKPKKKKVV